MDRLEQTIKNMSGSQNNNNYAIDNAFLSIFPLKDIDSLKDFDIRITNEPDFKLNVVRILNIFNFCFINWHLIYVDQYVKRKKLFWLPTLLFTNAYIILSKVLLKTWKLQFFRQLLLLE